MSYGPVSTLASLVPSLYSPLAAYMSPESPRHAAPDPCIRPPLSVQCPGRLCLPWICQQSSQLSNLGHRLPQGLGGTPFHPSLTSLAATQGKNGSIVRRQDTEAKGLGLQRSIDVQARPEPTGSCQPPAGP
jgi:hypothetical protein